MKKIIVISALFLFVLGLGLQAKEPMVLQVKAQVANVRAEPDAASAVIARLDAGTRLEATDKIGVWYEVSVKDAKGKAVTGYIHSTVVEVIGNGKEDEEEGEETPKSRPRQKALRAKAAGGVKFMGGLSFANMKVSGEIPPQITKKSKMGFIGGMGFETGGSFGLELDLLYVPGGTVLEAQVQGKTATITISGAGIAVPVLLKMRFMPGSSPYILAGGEFGYILSQKVIIAANGQEQERDVKDNINRLYYGLVFGAGFELQSGGLNLLFEGRFNLGLSNQVKEPDADEYAKATSISILIGVKL